MSKTPLTPLRSPPGQADLVDSLVAPGQVDQVESTQKRKHPEGCTCITCDCPSDFSRRPQVRELSDDQLVSVLKCAQRVLELRAVRRVIGVDEFKRLGLSIDLRLAERWVLIHADWLLEQGA